MGKYGGLINDTHPAKTGGIHMVFAGWLLTYIHISVGAGTSKNERLHRSVNTIAHGRGDMGLESATAILTLFFCSHNREKNGDMTPLVPGAIGALDKVTFQKPRMYGYGSSIENDAIMPLQDIEYMQRPAEDIFKDICSLLKVFNNLKSKKNKIEILFSSPYHGLSDGSIIRQPSILDDFDVIIGEKSNDNFQEFLKSHHEKSCFVEALSHPIESTCSESMQKVCDLCQCVLIILSDDPQQQIQSLIPKIICFPSPLLIYHNGKSFFTTIPKVSDEPPQKAPKIESVKKEKKFSCSCGKKRRNGTIESCKMGRCDCLKNDEGCGEKCQCYNCHNKNGQREIITEDITWCRCGRGSAKVGGKCTTEKCPCFSNENGCDENDQLVFIFCLLLSYIRKMQ
jgi:hypothetical protein